MAYLITKNNGLIFAASNASRRDLKNQSGTTDIDISDSDFNDLREGKKEVSISGSNATFTAISDASDNDLQTYYNNATELQAHFDEVSAQITGYLARNSGSFATELSNYKTYLEGVDKSSLTYPIKWEQYCSSNSITFFNIIEIPK